MERAARRLFPGSDAGASLKRSAPPRWGSQHTALFPGSDAGASLKLRTLQGPHRLAALFPGSDAGASLKREVGGKDHRAGSALPRQRCRGLIEAPVWVMNTQRMMLFPGSDAGASLKPLRTGGIAGGARASSPAAMPGPH